jgi:hypothetical protein
MNKKEYLKLLQKQKDMTSKFMVWLLKKPKKIKSNKKQ